MSYTCTCLDGMGNPLGSPKNVTSCDECSTSCTSNNYQCSYVENQDFAGISMGVFIALVVIQLLLWVFMIVFSVVVIKRCKGKPSWLNPTVILLLVFWFLFGWFPGIGFALFVALLVILIIYGNQCKNRKTSK